MTRYDVAVIGGGPGGYVAAIKAAQLGLATVVIEKDRLGGLCLNWGCIPSKALLWNAELVRLFRESEQFGITYDALRLDVSAAVDRSRQVVERMVKGVEYLLKKNRVTVKSGTGRLRSVHEIAVEPEGELVEAENIVVATGAHPRPLSFAPFDGDRIITSKDALVLREVPSSIAVIGGGPIGVELAYFYNAYGSEVTIIEFAGPAASLGG